MVGRSAINVFVLARERRLRRLLERLLRQHNGSVSYFSRQEDCLEGLLARPCDLLIVDCDGCAMDGLEVLAEAKQASSWIPAIILVDAGDIPKAVKAIKLGAVDCLEKPVKEDQLFTAVEQGLSRTRRCVAGVKALTRAEARVLQLILAGKSNGDIADVFHRSRRTVEVHRRNIMRKLNAGGTVDLVRWAVTTGFIEPERVGPLPV